MKNVSFKRSAYDQNRHISGYYTSILSENNTDGRIYFAKDGIYLGNGGSIGNADLIGLSQDKLNTILQDANGVAITKANLGTASTAVTLATTDASTKIATTEFVAASIAESAAARQALVLAGFAHPANGDDGFYFSNINTNLFSNIADILDPRKCDEFYKISYYDTVRAGYLFKVVGSGIIYVRSASSYKDISVESGDTIYITRDYIYVEGETNPISIADIVILQNNVDVFKGATASDAGTKGLVPAPAAGEQNYFLRGDGNWEEAGQVDGATINGTDLTVTDKKIIIPIANSNPGGYGVISETLASGILSIKTDYDEMTDEGHASLKILSDNVFDIDTAMGTMSDKLDTIVPSADKVNNFLLARNDESSILLRVNITNATNPSGSVNLDLEINGATLYKAGLLTAEDKIKLNSVESGSQANVQSDWNQTNTSADDYIKNKPTIPEAITVDSILNSGSTNPVQNKVITDKIVDLDDSISELYSNKVDKETNKSLMSNAEHAKLGGIPEDAASIGEFLAQPVRTDQTVVIYLEYTDKDGNHEPEAIIPSATSTDPGVMSAADKVKLDSVCTWEDE